MQVFTTESGKYGIAMELQRFRTYASDSNAAECFRKGHHVFSCHPWKFINDSQSLLSKVTAFHATQPKRKCFPPFMGFINIDEEMPHTPHTVSAKCFSSQPWLVLHNHIYNARTPITWLFCTSILISCMFATESLQTTIYSKYFLLRVTTGQMSHNQ